MGTDYGLGQRVIRDLRAIIAEPEQGVEAQVQRLLVLGCERFGADYGAALALESPGEALVRHVFGRGGPALGARFPLAGDGCELLLHTGEALAVERGDGLRLCGRPVRGLLGVSYPGGLLVFGAHRPASRQVDALDLDCLGLMGAWLGAELKHRRDEIALRAATRELRQLTRIDPLTQLLNRRGIEHSLRRLADRAGQDDRPTSAVLIDVDDFKRINDAHTHEVGDRVLVALADRIRQAVRASDRVARIGGDEFLAVLPDSSTDQARAAAERIRLAVRAAPVQTPAGPVPVSVSLGVAPIEPEHETVTEILRGVGQRLKRSKRAGKDRVTG